MTDRAREIAHKWIDCVGGMRDQFHNDGRVFAHVGDCDALTADIVQYGIEVIAAKPPLMRIDMQTGEITEARCDMCGAKL